MNLPRAGPPPPAISSNPGHQAQGKQPHEAQWAFEHESLPLLSLGLASVGTVTYILMHEVGQQINLHLPPPTAFRLPQAVQRQRPPSPRCDSPEKPPQPSGGTASAGRPLFNLPNYL